MPIPTPFHLRTQKLCKSYRWKEWAGYYAVCTYDMSPEREYNAVRQSAGLLDVTPLFKYEVTGPQAGELLGRLMVRNMAKQPIGRVAYLCWCDDRGKILDDGTCARLARQHYRVTSGGPAYFWLKQHAGPYDCKIVDSTGALAALALQGPTSRDILRQVTDADVDGLPFFGITQAHFGDAPGWLTRTGYTGDLGYELWVEGKNALKLWDMVMAAGRPYGIEPIGLDTLDITRIEAGFILRGVDYYGAFEALTDARRSTPFEVGLGWTVKLKFPRPPFIGEAALRREARRGSNWSLVGLDIDWEATERLFDTYGLPPDFPKAAWRTPVPVYHKGRQVGRATSGTWSPVLKKNLALATVRAEYDRIGTVLDIEMTVEWERKVVPAVVSQTPFFDPPRKKA